MPKRTDIKKVLMIGSGPIIIGQAAEFDFSGTQACRSLKEEGYEVVLINSNPATIMTDPDTADKIYVEPITIETVIKVLKKEQPDGILAGMGGQTALNICSELERQGILQEMNVELLGTQAKAIEDAEDREKFKELMINIGEPVLRGIVINSVEDALKVVPKLGGYPVLVRPSFTLGGTGGGIAYNEKELVEITKLGLAYSKIHEVLIEESVLGWVEYEYEVMRDSNNTCITICNMENIDPMGIHTGESIVIAPAQTLSDKDHQKLRSASLKIIRALKIEGGCNVQFCVDHKSGEYRVIEVNPRVSRSSALASKATGYPIARVSAKIAVGLRLDEVTNSITGKTMAAFEPTLDYVIIKIPRWPFDKFTRAEKRIGTQMKSTGEVMSIGRTVEEALLKAVRSLDNKNIGLTKLDVPDYELIQELEQPTDRRLYAVAECLRREYSVKKVADLSGYGNFYVSKIDNIVQMEKRLGEALGKAEFPQALMDAKALGFGDAYISKVCEMTEQEVYGLRQEHKIFPKYNMVDTCGGEFEAETPYYYSTYESPFGVRHDFPDEEKRILILGSGPIRIGQGIEFDYSCVHCVTELREQGWKALIINNNPETVSTDYDLSDMLFFEPITFEEVMNLIGATGPEGVVLQFGGQTSLVLAIPLMNALEGSGVRILGTSPQSIDDAEDREKWTEILTGLKIPQPRFGTGMSFEEVSTLAEEIGYPVLVRPSYVLGGRAMEIVYEEADLREYMTHAVEVSEDRPVLVDKFLSDAIEHSGDSICVIPPQTLAPKTLDTITDYTRKIATTLNTVGLINIQMAIKEGKVYIIEANPRASRTVPYVSKTTGVPLAKIATRLLLGEKLKDMEVLKSGQKKGFVSVKCPVFPFLKIPGLDPVLSPEMKSTGETMGVDKDFGMAYYKAAQATGLDVPPEGAVYITVNKRDKKKVVPLAREFIEQGFQVFATKGTAAYLRRKGIAAETIWRISEKRHPDAIDLMHQGKIDLIINTPSDNSGVRRDGYQMRRLAVSLQIPFLTTIPSAKAELEGIKAVRKVREQGPEVYSLDQVWEG
jgi:carbamoyl-phosphate synthase large subunit